MLTKLRVGFALVCALVLTWPGLLAAQVATPVGSPVAGQVAAGSLRAQMDSAVDPGEDFFRYATGGWQDRTDIPADEATYGITQELHDLTIEQLLALLDRLENSDELAVGSDEWKAVQLFAQAMDTATRNAQGIAPLEAEMEAIDAIANLDDLYAFIRQTYLSGYAYGLYGIFSAPDFADSSVYTAWYSGPALGLPSRDYYWIDDEGSEAIREAYRAMNAALLEAAGYDADEAADAAARVYDLEKQLAEPILRPEDFNDPGNYYNPRPVAELIAANPDFDWPAFLDMLGIPEQETVVVTELAYLAAVDEIVADADLETLKDYLKLQILQSAASALSEEIGQIVFDFYGTTLNGIEEQAPLAERALDDVNGSLGFALGRLYVDEYFPPQAKAEIEALVERLIDATRVRIDALEWMSPETKATAIEKLDAMRVKVGYPDVWRTYEAVTIEESLAQTLLSASLAESKRKLGRIGEPVDRDEWGMLPQEVNAYYSPTNNEIVFPAAILQSPFFDVAADPAFNYGGIGATIGHEITHGFDQGGSQFDAEGNFADWWTAEDLAEFEALTAEVAAQYDDVEVLPGLNVDGDLTIGENIADMGGLQIAYDALQTLLAEEGDPGPIEGLTQEERFFIAYALSWAEEAREEALRTQVLLDEHAPAAVRAVQPARNMDPFFAAFGIEPGEPMFLPPAGRIVIW
jgi:predicted metalloendopeptidase